MSDKMLIEKKKIENCLKKLFPLCRSITGNANRETLRVLSGITPIRIILPLLRHIFADWEIISLLLLDAVIITPSAPNPFV